MQASKHVVPGSASAMLCGQLILLLASFTGGCAQPNEEMRPGYGLPPPPIVKDAGFVVPDEDENLGEDDEGDGDSGDEETDGGGTGPLFDAGEDAKPDAQVPPSDAGPVTCTQTLCGSSCVDLDTSSQHCGACDHKCPGSAGCNAGTCSSPNGNCTYQLREGHDYLFCSNQVMWRDAREDCQDFGLDLVIVDDAAENDFVKGSAGRWIGLTDEDTDDDYRWIEPGGGTKGTVATYKPWAEDEPNHAQWCPIFIPPCYQEHCAEVLANGQWNDAQCEKNDVKRAFVCESY